MALSSDQSARLAELEAEFADTGVRGVELADEIDHLRAIRDGVTPSGLGPGDVVGDVVRALALIDDNGDLDELREYGLVDSALTGAATAALRALRDSMTDL